MKKSHLILISAAVVIVLGGFGYHRFYHDTPYRTLNEIRKSAEDKDWESFSSWVDVKEIVVSLAGNISDEVSEEDEFAGALAEMLGGALSGVIESALKEWIETGEQDQDAVSGFSEMLDGLSSGGLPKYTMDGKKIALMPVPVESEFIDTVFYCRLKFRKTDNSFRLVGILDMVEAMEKLESTENIYKRYLAAPRQKIIDEALDIRAAKIEKKCTDYSQWVGCLDESILIDFEVENRNEIQSARWLLVTPERNEFRFEAAFQKGSRDTQSFSLDYNQFLSEHKELVNTSLDHLNTVIQSVTFTDGRVVSSSMDEDVDRPNEPVSTEKIRTVLGSLEI